MTIKKEITEETKKFWEFAEKASREVEKWPAWKRLETSTSNTDLLTCRKSKKKYNIIIY